MVATGTHSSVTYKKSLDIFVERPIQRTSSQSEVFPSWAVHATVGTLSGSLCLAFSVCVVRNSKKRGRRWLTPPQRTRVLSVGHLELVCATDFVDFGCLVKYEHLREEGKLQVLDTVEKLRKIRQTRLMLFLSHQSFAVGVPDPSGLHFKAMCAAACTIAMIANVSLHSVFLWVCNRSCVIVEPTLLFGVQHLLWGSPTVATRFLDVSSIFPIPGTLCNAGAVLCCGASLRPALRFRRSHRTARSR